MSIKVSYKMLKEESVGDRTRCLNLFPPPWAQIQSVGWAQEHKGTMNKGSSCSVNAFTSIRADSSVMFCVLCRLTECSLCRERLMVLCWADKGSSHSSCNAPPPGCNAPMAHHDPSASGAAWRSQGTLGIRSKSYAWKP